MSGEIIVGVTVGVVVALFSYFINRNSTKNAVDLTVEKIKDLLTHQEFLKAAAEFEATFTNLQIELDNITEKTERHIPIEILKSHIKNIKKAMIDFSNTLPERDRASFKNVWLNFSCEDYKRKKQPPYYNYLLNTSIIEVRDRMINNINELLKFAK